MAWYEFILTENTFYPIQVVPGKIWIKFGGTSFFSTRRKIKEKQQKQTKVNIEGFKYLVEFIASEREKNKL